MTMMARIAGFMRSGPRYLSLGIRREDKSCWEARAPLIPGHVQQLIKDTGIRVVVQPCTRRAFRDIEYSSAGAIVQEDLSECDIVIGIKEIPIESVARAKAYMCFSHTHKGQPHNMPFLQAAMKKNITLLDYELLKDSQGNRLAAFGRYAGYAGMINALHGFGNRLLQRGFRTPFVNIALAHNYRDLSEAKRAIELVAQDIRAIDLPKELKPLIFICVGDGNVSQGAQEILRIFPHKIVSLPELSAVSSATGNCIYIAVACSEDLYIDSKTGKFSPDLFQSCPERLVNVFAEKYAPFASLIVNGIYWEPRFGRLLTKAQLKTLKSVHPLGLVTIADISCDINGSIECTSRATKIEDPFFVYDPETGLEIPSQSLNGIQVMSIDNLPAQLPADASMYFSGRLYPVMKTFIEKGLSDQCLKSAAIMIDGELSSDFLDLEQAISKNKRKNVLILGSGFVCGPVVDYLAKLPFIQITIGTEYLFTCLASNQIEEARRLAKGWPNVKICELDVFDRTKLSSLVSSHNLAISLVPALLHPIVAETCIENGVNMITASYVSPALKALDQKAKDRGVLVLNEVGLDPGLDHLSALDAIDRIRSQGDAIEGFVSWCGGLPAPECAGSNPFGYKFSWNPAGVLLAAQNDARYLQDGKIISIKGQDLLQSAKPLDIHCALKFEGIPNRDSLQYREAYGLQNIATMLRGTLRFQLGFLENQPIGDPCSDMRSFTARVLGHEPTYECISRRFSFDIKKFYSTLTWLDMNAFDVAVPDGKTILKVFSKILFRKMQYSEMERDMVFMAHEFRVSSKNGNRKTISSSLLEYGDSKFSAMARTVGFPVALAAELVLKDTFDTKGVIAPFRPEIFKPLYAALDRIPIRFQEIVA